MVSGCEDVAASTNETWPSKVLPFFKRASLPCFTSSVVWASRTSPGFACSRSRFVLSFARTTASDGRSRALIAAVDGDGPLVVVWLPRGKEMLAATISKVAIRIICLLQNKRLPTIIAEVYRKKKGRSSLRSALGLKFAIGLEGEARRHLNLAARYRRTNERPVRARRRNIGVNDLAELTARNVANRVSEVRMVQHVVHVGPNCKDVLLRQMKILQDRKVGVEVPRTAEEVPDP